jgi:hypothetical protein
MGTYLGYREAVGIVVVWDYIIMNRDCVGDILYGLVGHVRRLCGRE